MALHTALEDSVSLPKTATPLLVRYGLNTPNLGRGEPKSIPCVSKKKYFMPWPFSISSSPGLYPHSGSHMPQGLLPKTFEYRSTATLTCALTELEDRKSVV